MKIGDPYFWYGKRRDIHKRKVIEYISVFNSFLEKWKAVHISNANVPNEIIDSIIRMTSFKEKRKGIT